MGRDNDSINIDYESLVYKYLYTYYDKEIIDYLDSITSKFPYQEEDIDLYCCLQKTDENNNLLGLKIVVPMPIDLKSSRVFIHEYKHGLDLYKYLGKKIGDIYGSENEEYELRAKNEEFAFCKNIRYLKY